MKFRLAASRSTNVTVKTKGKSISKYKYILCLSSNKVYYNYPSFKVKLM